MCVAINYDKFSREFSAAGKRDSGEVRAAVGRLIDEATDYWLP